MSILSDAINRLRALAFRGREERELDEELRFHLDMETARQRAQGLDDREARRRSLIALGGVDRTKESVRDARGTAGLTDGWADVAYALRGLRHRPGFTAVVVLTLALGIGGTTAVFSAVDAVLLRPLPFQQPGRLVRIYQSDTRDPGDRGFVTPYHFLAFRERTTSFEAVASIGTYSETGADIGTGDAVRRIRLLQTSADYFDVMRTPPHIGHAFQRDAETAAPVVVLSDALWRERFGGSPDAVGKALIMNGKPYTVLGVMPAGYSDPVLGAVDAIVPVDITPGRDPANVDNHYLGVVARLRPGVTLAAAQADVDGVMRAIGAQYPDVHDGLARIYPLKDDVVGSASRSLEIMLGAVALVLLLVCVNVANLLLVRGTERTREFALRTALGAQRGRIVRQLLVESLTLAVVGGVVGLAVARLAMAGMVALGQGTIPRIATMSLDWPLLLFAFAVATGSALLFGAAPALRASRVDAGDALRAEGRAATGGMGAVRLRESLVVVQVAMAFVLVVGAGLLVASIQRIRGVPLGIAPAKVLSFEVHLPNARYDSTARRRFYDALPANLERLPGVVAAGSISKLPAAGHFNQWGNDILTGPLAKTARGNLMAEERVIAGDYFRAAGIPIVAGRTFDARDDATAPRRVLISKSFADAAYPNVDPIGQRLHTGGFDVEVIGVVGDVSVDNEGTPARYVYHAHRQFAGDRNWSLTQVVSTAGDPSALVQPARALLATMDPQLVLYHPAPLDEVIGRGAAQRVFTLRLLGAFAGVAIALAALGLFGVLSYGVRLRTREIGIRVALGADQGGIRAMILRQGLALAGVGVMIGLVAAAAGARAMTSLVFEVSPFDPMVYAMAAGFMTVVAALAAYLPARRATRIDPRTALQ